MSLFFLFVQKQMMTDLLVNNSRGGTLYWTPFSTDSSSIIYERRSLNVAEKEIDAENWRYNHPSTYIECHIFIHRRIEISNLCIAQCFIMWMMMLKSLESASRTI